MCISNDAINSKIKNQLKISVELINGFYCESKLKDNYFVTVIKINSLQKMYKILSTTHSYILSVIDEKLAVYFGSI